MKVKEVLLAENGGRLQVEVPGRMTHIIRCKVGRPICV